MDECERLWFADSGVINTNGGEAENNDKRGFILIKHFLINFTGKPTIVQRPSIWVIDLKTDNILSRYEIPESVASSGSGFASLTIDNDANCQGESFAYLPDLVSSQIVVYNLKENKSYRVEHNYFHMHPLEGFYDIDGLKFSWNDAIFSIALSGREKNSPYRLAYFHPMSRFD